MTDEQFKEFMKAMGVKDKEENHQKINRNLTQDELKRIAAKIVIPQGEE